MCVFIALGRGEWCCYEHSCKGSAWVCTLDYLGDIELTVELLKHTEELLYRIPYWLHKPFEIF